LTTRVLEQAVLCVFGEGGHEAQMTRLVAHLGKLDCEIPRLVALTDSARPVSWAAHRYGLGPARHKHSGLQARSAIVHIWGGMNSIRRILRHHDVRLMISTGPGLVLIPAILLRLAGRPVIHIETWSRFDTRSFTGRAMYRIATEFWVQHRELQSCYPRARYVGLL
jgi:beta-1,4-N-acetylglucosaminyltransferase